MSHTVMQLLGELPSAEPDGARSERTRRRCRAQFTRYVPTEQAAGASRATQFWQPLIALLGVAYLTEVIVQAFWLYIL
jgi:hypothetical protein